MTEEQIKHMVNRFLSWKLPENFNPDGGIIFSHTSGGRTNTPTGTNLLDYTQATAMVRHMLEGLPDNTRAISERERALVEALRQALVVHGDGYSWGMKARAALAAYGDEK